MLIVLQMCSRILYDKIANSCYHYAKRYYITRYWWSGGGRAGEARYLAAIWYMESGVWHVSLNIYKVEWKYSNYIAYLSSKAIECQLTSQKQLLHNHLEQLNKESEIPLDLAKICPDKGVLAITNWQNALAFASSNDLLAYWDLKKIIIYFWQLWDLNPRPFGLVPKTSALDHSAKLPLVNNCFHNWPDTLLCQPLR